MDVYLVPVGPDRFECYYEAAEQEDTAEPVEGRGFFARLRARFNAQLKEAEEARHQKSIEEPHTFLGRMQKHSMRWIAERVAEQRLLWHLRSIDSANLHVPTGLPADQADSIMRDNMKWDADHHRNRLIIHSLALIISVPVALVPGPNVLGYLFTFTVVGHFLAWRGAVRAWWENSELRSHADSGRRFAVHLHAVWARAGTRSQNRQRKMGLRSLRITHQSARGGGDVSRCGVLAR